MLILANFSDITIIYKLKLSACVSGGEERGEFELLMPDAQPTEPETYLCTTIRLDKNNTYYITGFDPKVDQELISYLDIYLMQ